MPAPRHRGTPRRGRLKPHACGCVPSCEESGVQPASSSSSHVSLLSAHPSHFSVPNPPVFRSPFVVSLPKEGVSPSSAFVALLSPLPPPLPQVTPAPPKWTPSAKKWTHRAENWTHQAKNWTHRPARVDTSPSSPHPRSPALSLPKILSLSLPKGGALLTGRILAATPARPTGPWKPAEPHPRQPTTSSQRPQPGSSTRTNPSATCHPVHPRPPGPCSPLRSPLSPLSARLPQSLAACHQIVYTGGIQSHVRPQNLHARPPPLRPPPRPQPLPAALRCPLPSPRPPVPPLTAPTFLADPTESPPARSRGSPIQPSPTRASRVSDSANRRPTTPRTLAHPPSTP